MNDHVGDEEAKAKMTPEEKKKRREEMRKTWVRGWCHVLPIDHEKGKWKGPTDLMLILILLCRLDDFSGEASI